MTFGIKKNERRELLRGVWLLSGCSNRELDRIATLTTLHQVTNGQVLSREGEPGIEFFIIVSGRAIASIGHRTIGEIGPGSFFGEMALLDGGTRTATVTAVEPMTVLVLSRRQFSSFIGAVMPSVATKMLTALGSRLRTMNEEAAKERAPTTSFW